MYTSVIFDLDGTLLDTVTDLALATNKTLEENGFEALAEDNYNHYLGDGAINLIKRVLADQPDHLQPSEDQLTDLVPKLVSEMKAHYAYLWSRNTRPYDGIKELVNKLKENGSILGVVSNKPHDFAVEMTEYFFGTDIFEIILGQKSGTPVKPAPDALYNAITTMGIEKASLLYIGDTDTDMKTAKNADVTSVGVTWGFRNEDELKKHGANFIVHKASEIIKVYRGQLTTK